MSSNNISRYINYITKLESENKDLINILLKEQQSKNFYKQKYIFTSNKNKTYIEVINNIKKYLKKTT